MLNRKTGLIAMVVVTLLGVNHFIIWQKEPAAQAYHPEGDLAHFRYMAAQLPTGYNSLLAASGECVQCHESKPGVMQDTAGNDISPATQWRATMMANAARDPFWRAQVKVEKQLNTGLHSEIEHTCTKCHAPQGHFAAVHDGATYYALDSMIHDPIALDGVGCNACHQLLPDSAHRSFSGHLQYDTLLTIYGPYQNIWTPTMLSETGYFPAYSAHLSESELCAGCYTLFTDALDWNSNPTGTKFIEGVRKANHRSIAAT